MKGAVPKPNQPNRILWSLLCLVVAAPVFAADGLIQINHARALAGGVTAGDTAGYPVTLSESGSYLLTGNLTAPNQNTTILAETAERVSIDLNGFAIVGATVCAAPDLSNRVRIQPEKTRSYALRRRRNRAGGQCLPLRHGDRVQWRNGNLRG